MLTLESVSHTFPDGTCAIDTIDLNIKKGEFCVLLGSSGAGKSTLMGVINGFVMPSKGNIFFDNEQITAHNLKRLQRRVSMIHQQLHLVSRVSVLHNVISGKLYSIPTWRTLFKHYSELDQRRACKLLEKVGLEEKHLQRRASELSGGQQQRVAIARAFMSSPDIVLADEPVASLDPTTSHSVLRSLKNTSRQHNKTVICSLHQVEYAREYADRVIALRKGKIVFNGSPKALDASIINNLYSNNESIHPRDFGTGLANLEAAIA